jgi:hypothetical protein
MLFLAFCNVGPGDMDTFFAVLSLPPERLGEVRRRTIFARHVMGLSEFHDTLLPFILYFRGDIGDESSCGEIFLIYSAATGFSSFAF